MRPPNGAPEVIVDGPSRLFARRRVAGSTLAWIFGLASGVVVGALLSWAIAGAQPTSMAHAATPGLIDER